MFSYRIFDDFGDDFHSVLVGVDAVGGVHVIEIIIEAAMVEVGEEEVVAGIVDRGFDDLIEDLGALL